MNQNEENNLEASLEVYKLQVSQVEQAIQVAGETPDLNQLRNDLLELIKLTEDNLLQLKKARLLKALDEQSVPVGSTSTSLDDEFAAFQSSLADELSPANSNIDSSSTNQSTSHCAGASSLINKDPDSFDSSDSDDSEDDAADGSSYFSDLIGTKCRAPFHHEYGGHHYGNAMIWSADPPSDITDAKEYMVRVIFLNPVHPSLITCSYYLDGQCRFSDQDCRRSHGHPVLVSELKPFIEPDHSKIKEGCRCLAKFTDEVWYPGTVVDICDDHQVNVRFDSQKEESTVLVEHVLPLESESDSEDDDDKSDDDAHRDTAKSHNDDDERPAYMWTPAQTTDKMGAWETHTKGIGSKLMAKMGYITGQGLGPEGLGRAEPVPIMLLPQGKSLDKIMELKEMSGNDDMFNAMKKLEKRQKLMEKKELEKEERKERKDNWGVFGFINNKLGDKKGQYRVLFCIMA
ncbi:zinc finger CCCH-type with G patch domain-containing protein [Biomphalaria glabrata]|nr:zinc finger CCCH-type with G patch domain-containing protein [Biomphalaria glabrata]